MKQVLPGVTRNIISVDELTGDEIIAYRCKPSGVICLLGKVSDNQFGFVSIGPKNFHPSYREISIKGSIRLAMTQREVYVFNSELDLMNSIMTNKF